MYFLSNDSSGVFEGSDTQWDPAEERLRLDAWRRREESKWRAELQKREDAKLELLAREWRAAERRRAAEARGQCRAMAAVTSEMKHKLALLCSHEEMLEQTAQQLALKGAELERQGDIERAELLTAAEKERVAMRAELDGMLAQLREAREREGALEQRAAELVASEVRAKTEATVWKTES